MLVSPPAGGGLAADTVTATASSPAFADPEDPGPVRDTADRKIYRSPAYSISGAEQFAVQNGGEPLLPVGWTPAEVRGEELVAVAVDQREEGGCRMVAIAACPQPRTSLPEGRRKIPDAERSHVSFT